MDYIIGSTGMNRIKGICRKRKTFAYTIIYEYTCWIYIKNNILCNGLWTDHLVYTRPCRQLGVKSGCGCNGFIKRMLYNSVIFLCDTYYDEKNWKTKKNSIRAGINYPYTPIVRDRKIQKPTLTTALFVPIFFSLLNERFCLYRQSPVQNPLPSVTNNDPHHNIFRLHRFSNFQIELIF